MAPRIRSAPCAARDTHLVEGLDTLSLDGTRLCSIAASLNCVAAAESAEVRAFMIGLAPWVSGLKSCADKAQLPSIVAQIRPDIVIIGPDFKSDDLKSLLDGITTSGLGLAVLGLDNTEVEERFSLAGETSRRIEVEPIEGDAPHAAVVLRLRALLRRCRPGALVQTLSYGDMLLDESALTLCMGGKTAPLALEGFRLLAPMFDDPEHVWTREELLRHVYGSLSTNSIRTIDVKLNVTRRRLRALLGSDPVRSVRGEGYRLVARR